MQAQNKIQGNLQLEQHQGSTPSMSHEDQIKTLVTACIKPVLFMSESGRIQPSRIALFARPTESYLRRMLRYCIVVQLNGAPAQLQAFPRIDYAFVGRRACNLLARPAMRNDKSHPFLSKFASASHMRIMLSFVRIRPDSLGW